MDDSQVTPAADAAAANSSGSDQADLEWLTLNRPTGTGASSPSGDSSQARSSNPPKGTSASPGKDAAGADSGSEGSEEAPTSPMMDKAMQALRRALPKGMHASIDKMSPQEILEHGLELAERQAEQDRFRAEHDRSRAGDKDSETQDTDPDDAAGEPVKAKPIDLANLLKDLDPDIHTPELVEALPKIAESIQEQVLSQVQSMLKQADKTVGQRFDGLVRDDVERQLGERFPKLRDAAARKEVMAAFERLERADSRKIPVRDRMAENLELACIQKLGAPSQSQPRPSVHSQPAVPNRSAASTPTMTDEEKSHAWLNARRETGSVAAANRAAGY